MFLPDYIFQCFLLLKEKKKKKPQFPANPWSLQQEDSLPPAGSLFSFIHALLHFPYASFFYLLLEQICSLAYNYYVINTCINIC